MLEINSILPEGDIDAGFEPITVDLEVETSGGADNGRATCYYNFNQYSKDYQFFDTFGNSHKQNFNMMLRGDYTVYITCEDYAGNVAQETGNFRLVIDTFPPIVARAYYDGGSLRLITTEDAECYYSFDRCSFNIENATSMTTAFSREHSATWNTGVTYYVKCADIWGNIPNECNIKILPEALLG